MYYDVSGRVYKKKEEKKRKIKLKKSFELMMMAMVKLIYFIEN